MPGLGRDIARVARLAHPPLSSTHGLGRLVGGPDPLVKFFVGDAEVGIAGTGVRAGMLKVVTDAGGITEDVARVMTAAAVAFQQTGVPIITHSCPDLRNGLDQHRFLRAAGATSAGW